MPSDYFYDGFKISDFTNKDLNKILSKYNVITPIKLNNYENRLFSIFDSNNIVLTNIFSEEDIENEYKRIKNFVSKYGDKYYFITNKIKDTVKEIKDFHTKINYIVKTIKEEEYNILFDIKDLKLKYVIDIIELGKDFVIMEKGEKIKWKEDFLNEPRGKQYNYILNMFEAVKELNYNGIYHCDIKKDNFVKVENVFKLIDFDYSTMKLGKTNIRGTSKYISPDGIFGEVKKYRDFWSFTALLVYVYTGKSYFEQIHQFLSENHKEQLKQLREYYLAPLNEVDFSLGNIYDDTPMLKLRDAIKTVLNIQDDSNPLIYESLNDAMIEMKLYVCLEC